MYNFMNVMNMLYDRWDIMSGKKYDKRNNSDTLKYRSDNVVCFLLRNWAFCKVLSEPEITLQKEIEFATFVLSARQLSHFQLFGF